MISYEPLMKTLDNKGLSVIDVEHGIKCSSRTTAKLRKNQPVNLTTIEKICIYLDVPIEQVVRIVPNESDKQ